MTISMVHDIRVELFEVDVSSMIRDVMDGFHRD